MELRDLPMTVGEERRIKRASAERLAFNYELSIFPVEPNGKRPALSGWRAAATRDMRQINTWWSENPDCNIGVSAIGLFIVDVDPQGIEAWRQMSEGKESPPTLRVSTPRGGFHIYYRLPAGEDAANSVGRIAEGIDVRGAGGYVVGPGSLIEGRWYTIIDRGAE